MAADELTERDTCLLLLNTPPRPGGEGARTMTAANLLCVEVEQLHTGTSAAVLDVVEALLTSATKTLGEIRAAKAGAQ
jgi:hypothetical protein